MEFPSFLIVLNAFLLGLRHGIDWDHLAAIFDIVSGSSLNSDESGKAFRDSCASTFAYTTGHGLVVVLLGTLAICLSKNLPHWIDGIMDTMVGLSLIFLGCWVFYSAFRSLKSGNFSRMRIPTRGMLIADLFARLSRKLTPAAAAVSGSEIQIDTGRTAFTIGALHGIGAETGTQIFLLSAVAVTDQLLGLIMLLVFVTGLITCNMLVAVLGTRGFITLSRMKELMLVVAVFTGTLSLVIGILFTTGQAGILPDLEKLLP